MKKGIITPNKIVCKGDECYIHLTNHKKETIAKAIVDKHFLPVILKHHWYLSQTKRQKYVMSTFPYGEHRKRVKLHNLIAGYAPKGHDVDHINRNPLDNRAENLRICTKYENARNKNIYKTNTSGTPGVNYYPNTKSWQARINVNGKRILLGYFKTKKEAVDIRKKAEKKLW